jgi:ubiquinone biosynthesis protein
VSQVHRAVLAEDGTMVVVKVLRPNAEVVFHRDLRNIGTIISFLDLLRFAPHVHFRKGLEALKGMVVEEIDFRFEAANTRRMRKSLREHHVYVPKVFLEHSTARVLVSEFVAGVLMSDFIRIGQNDPERAKRWAAENRVEPKKLAQKLFSSAVRQFLEDNLFHGDLHPGNILLLKDNRFALIDFGTIGSADHTFLLTYRASLIALAEKDYLRAADMTLRLAISPPGPGVLEALRQEIVASYKYWEARSHLAGTDYHERSLAAAGTDSGRIMFKYHVQLTWEFMRISRTWSTLDASLSFLMPEANYMRLFKKYFKQAQKRSMRPGRIASGIMGAVRKTIGMVEEYHDMLGPVVRKQPILKPSFINAGERFLRFARTWFKIFANVVIVGAIVGGLMELDRYHPELFQFENRILHELADEQLTGEEIWWLALGAALIVGWMIRRALRSVDKDPQ